MKKSYLTKRIYHITGDVHYIGCLMNPQNTILTIHDAVPLHNKLVPWYSKFICYWLWFYFPLKHLKYITCISETTKQDISSLFPWAKDKLIVIPNPVGEEFEYTPLYNNTTPIILHIGTRSNKNLERVIESLSGLKIILRIVGRLSEHQQALLQQNKIDFHNISDISDEQMLDEYKHCDIVSFPSLFEGFGMPIIEGQSVGRPVLTSNIEPMLSVSGKCAMIVDPQNTESIRNGFLQLINDTSLRMRIVEDGLNNASKYKIENIVNQYEQLYRTISNKRL